MADLRILTPSQTTRSGFVWLPKLDGVFYSLRFRWIDRGKFWTWGLASVSGETLLSGLRVVTGVALNAPFCRAEHPPGQLFVLDSDGLSREPGRNAFRTTHDLVYRPAADVAAAEGTALEVR